MMSASYSRYLCHSLTNLQKGTDKKMEIAMSFPSCDDMDLVKKIHIPLIFFSL
jgi:hypothetical protein